jgi:uncharacterized membrane protein YqjE
VLGTALQDAAEPRQHERREGDNVSEPHVRGNADGGRGGQSGREQGSVGQTVSEVAADLSKLMRQELELARIELRQEARTAGKGGGMLGGGAVAAWIAAVLGSLALIFALAAIEPLNLGWSALIVAVLWAIISAVLVSMGKREMKKVGPPKQTTDSLKEDQQWAKTQLK